MSHAQNVLAQLRLAEGDEDLPEDLRERAAERAAEIEAAAEEAMDHVETNQGGGQ